jgi:hypothetical protein
MKTTFNYATILGCLLTATSVAIGQNNGATVQASTNVAVAQGVGASEPYYGFGHIASTAEAGVVEGVGGLVRSQGEANYFNSLSTINGQEAYSRFLQNAERSNEAYFRIKQINQAARQATEPQRLTYEQYAAMAKRYAPEGLNEQQYDRTLGRLNWPAVLTGEEFSAERDALNRSFMVRTPLDAGPASGFYGYVRRVADSMDAKLKTKFSDLSSAEYLAAKKFITGLTMESQQPLVVRALAGR